MPSLYAYRRKTRSVLQRPTMARDPNSCAARRDGSGDHRQCQGSNVRAFHLVEVAFKSPQIVLVDTNGPLTQATFCPEILEESGRLGSEWIAPRLPRAAILRLRHDKAEELPNRGAYEVAIAATRIPKMVGSSGGKPVGDKRVDEGLCLLDLRDAASFGEGCELHEDRDPPKNCARRIALIAKDRDIRLDPRSEPAPQNPVDRHWLEEEPFQHDNLHSMRRNRRVFGSLLSGDVPRQK